MKSGQSNETNNIFKHFAELEPQSWYHGFRPNREIKRLLKEPGDFVVRHKFTYFILSFVDRTKVIRHWPISLRLPCLSIWLERRHYQSTFTSVVELVEHYRTHPLKHTILLKQGIPREHWNIKKEQIVYDNEKDLLGVGQFSNVYKALYKRTNERPITVAVKCFDEKDQSLTAIESRKALLCDAESFRFCRNENVAQLFGVVSDVFPTMVVMEHCIGGTLESHLKKYGEDIRTGELIVYCLEAAHGLMYLHIKNCIHQNLAARNCLIAADGRIKVSDYGVSTLIKNDINKKGCKNVEEVSYSEKTIRWMAPECLAKPIKYSKKSDVWSFGVLMYEIFNNGIAPFPDEKLQEIVQKIKNCKLPTKPEDVPLSICDIIGMLWVPDPKKRPTMTTVRAELKEILKDMNEMEELEYLFDRNFSVNRIPGVKRKYGPY